MYLPWNAMTQKRVAVPSTIALAYGLRSYRLAPV